MAQSTTRRGIVALFTLTGFTQIAASNDVPPVASVESALAEMHAWVGEGENGRRWRAYLMSDRIEAELQQAESAEAESLEAPLARYRSQVQGLDRPRFTAVRTALAAWQQSLAASQEPNLADLARSAGAEFVPVSPAQVATARQDLLERVRRLDALLASAGQKGQAWKSYLLWDQLQAQLASEGPPDFSALGQVHRQFRAMHEGLELPEFTAVADALKRYGDLANLARFEDQSRRYKQQIDLLAADLEAYQNEATDELEFDIGRRLGFVDNLGQSPRLFQAARRRLARPNLRARISADLISAAVAQDVHDTRHVTDVILGTTISGPATTAATLSARTVSSGSGPGRIELMLRGAVHSNTVGRNGPVRIYSTAETPFASVKTVLVDQYGIRHQTACSSATTCSDIHCIQPVKNGIGSGLIEKIAWKRASRQKGQAEAIAADHAEVRISRSFDARSLDLLADAQANYNRNFRLPLIRRKEFPEYFKTRSTSDGLFVTLLHANHSQLGAATPPSESQDRYDLALAVHQSLPNNLANSWLSGYRLTDDWLREQIREGGGDVPPELQEDQEPWSILFANQRPVSVTFGDGGFAATVRGLEFTSGDEAYGAMNITVRYSFESTDGGVLLRREGDLEILPPDFRPGTDRLTADQSALREVLIRRLGEVLKPEIRGEGLELPGELGRAGKLLPVEATGESGWLHLGWNRARERTVVADRSKSPRDSQRFVSQSE